MLPSDTVLQTMTDAELERLWNDRPRYPQTAGEMDWYRVAKELRYRNRNRRNRTAPRPSLRMEMQ